MAKKTNIEADSDTQLLDNAIERAKNQLEQMIDVNPDIIILIDNTGNIMRVNKAFLDFTGSPDFRSVIGRNLSEVFNLKKSADIKRLISGEKPASAVESKVNMTGGVTKTLLFTVIGGEKNAALKVVLVKDVTGEKETGRRVEKRLKMKAIEELTGALMHNINQPLTVITVKAQLMNIAIDQGRIDKEEFRKSLSDISGYAMEISQMLQKAGNPVDYQTEEYSESVDILDLKRSCRSSSFFDIDCPEAIDITYEALAMHDPTALRHARMVGQVSGIIAEAYGFEKNAVATVKRCGTLHDIGKICIPDSILQKPEALSEDERKIMMKHSTLGFRLLQRVTGFEKEADAALNHHEHFNGQGYPKGISGLQIPLETRIVSVADVLDAMMDSRHYHTAMQFDEAVQYITNNSGTQFDSEVVNAFRKSIEEIRELYRVSKFM